MVVQKWNKTWSVFHLPTPSYLHSSSSSLTLPHSPSPSLLLFSCPDSPTPLHPLPVRPSPSPLLSPPHPSVSLSNFLLYSTPLFFLFFRSPPSYFSFIFLTPTQHREIRALFKILLLILFSGEYLLLRQNFQGHGRPNVQSTSAESARFSVWTTLT